MGLSGSDSDVTPGDIQEVFSQGNESCTPLTTDEVATRLDCPTETALRNLKKLVELDGVETKRLDTSTHIWWQSNEPELPGRRTKSAEYSTLVSAVKDYAIFTLDPDGTVVSWNDGAERIKGYDKDEIVGEHFSTFYTSSDIDAGVPQENLETATAEGRVEDEGWRVREDGSRFWANVVITAVRDEDGELRGFTKVTRDMTERREYEQQLRRERDQTEQLIRTAPIAIAVQNADGETVMANQRAQEALGLTEQEILEEPADADKWTVYDMNGEPVPPDEIPSARVLATAEPVLNEELRIDPPSGDRVVFHINAAPIFDSDGAIERVITAGEDITELKERERQLEQRKRELETELGEILNRISDAFYALDDDFRFTHLNERAADLMERTPDELLGQDVWEVFPDAREGVYWENLHRALDTQEPGSFEVYEEDLNAWFEFNVYPSESGLSVYFRDVTDRTQRERELQRTERRFDAIFEDPNILVGLLDLDGTVLDINQTAMEYIDADLADVTGEPFWETPWWGAGDGAQPEVKNWVERAAGGEYVDFEADLTRPDGEQYTLDGVFRPVTNDEGDVVSIIVSDRDVTERRQFERALVEREQQLSTLMDNVPGVVYRCRNEPGWPMEFVSDACKEITGYEPEALEEGDVSYGDDIMVEADRDEVREEIQSTTTDQEPFSVTYRIETADGDRRWVSSHGRGNFDDGTLVELEGIITDITERKRLEAELKESERRYRTLVEHFPNGAVALVTEDLHYQTIGGDPRNVAGVTPEQAAGNSVAEVLPSPLADELIPRYEAAFEGDNSTVEIELDDQVFQFQVVPIRDDAGDVFAALGMSQEITERREYERKLEASNERLEQFAYAVSHDLQEPLRMITSYVQLLDQRYTDELDEEAREFIEFAVDGAERMREMIEALLEYSRVETQGDPFEPTDLDAVLSDVRDDLQLQIEEHDAEITTESLPPVRGDPGQLRQVFQNLLDNAIEYSGEEPPQIEIGAERNGSMWEVSVHDEGIGIDPDETDRVFEVFQRLHSQEDHSGTGIGLALCRRIIERHGGEIWVESEPGEGSTFSFTLPQAGETDE